MNSTQSFKTLPTDSDDDERPITPFDEIKISTKVMVVNINIDIDIKSVFEKFPVHEFENPPSTKSKKRLRAFIEAQNLPTGTIVAMEWEKHRRGLDIKHFLNAMTVMMIIKNKYINFKISAKGRIQITGCAFDEYAEKCIQYLWEFLLKYSTPDAPLYTFHHNESYFASIFHVVMSNRNFHLGFLVNRQKLDRYVNTQSDLECSSALEETFGYTGLKIKLPYARQNIPLTTLAYKNDTWVKGYMDYNEYLKQLSPKEYAKEIEKSRKNSFMVFHSGNSIMSGSDTLHMREPYYDFMKMIQRCRDEIEDRIVE